MTYGQIVGLTFIIFGQIVALKLIKIFASVLSIRAHKNARKCNDNIDYAASVRGIEEYKPDDKKDRVIGFK